MQRHCRDLIKKVQRTKRQNREIIIKVPLAVLGEILCTACEERCEIEKILVLLKSLDVDTPGPNMRIIEETKILMEKDDRMTPNDAFIISHAICDPSATWFFTTDGTIIESLEVHNEMKRHENRFSITDTFREKKHHSDR